VAGEINDDGQIHRARAGGWSARELKDRLAAIVDALVESGACSPLGVAIDLLGGELETFVVFGRLGHLDPPRPDGNIAWAIVDRMSDDPVINEKLRSAVTGWARRDVAVPSVAPNHDPEMEIRLADRGLMDYPADLSRMARMLGVHPVRLMTNEGPGACPTCGCGAGARHVLSAHEPSSTIDLSSRSP